MQMSALSGGANTFPSSGNVGIGTTSPVSSLDVNGALTADDSYQEATLYCIFESSHIKDKREGVFYINAKCFKSGSNNRIKMRKILITVLTIIITQAKAQNIVGLWQFGSPTVSSGYFETYQFFANGNFCFNTNQSDGLRRVLSIGGKYKVTKDKLVFTVEYTIELIGGNLERSHITTGSDSWALDNGQQKKLPLGKPIVQQASFQAAQKEKGEEVILIDLQKYYKVDDDPSIFK